MLFQYFQIHLGKESYLQDHMGLLQPILQLNLLLIDKMHLME